MDSDVGFERPTGTADTVKPRRPLLNSFITLSDALTREGDMLAELQYAQKRANFYNDLEDRPEEIKELVAFHCGLRDPSVVQVPKVFGKDGELLWRHGSFNVCIPVSINRTDTTDTRLPFKLGFRVPLPYRIGEEAFPGNSEEKVRSEAATYIWVNKYSPDISIPKLRGFGLAGGPSFCEPQSLSLWQKTKFRIWCFIQNLYRNRKSITSDYAPRKRTMLLDRNYILMDWIEDNNLQMLSNVFLKPHTDLQSENLYRGISKIMISLPSIHSLELGLGLSIMTVKLVLPTGLYSVFTS